MTAMQWVAPTIIEANPPNGIRKRAYSYRFAATGNPAPTWSVVAGALPAGLALDATTGALSGGPFTAGMSTFVVQADNGVSAATAAVTLRITRIRPPT